MWLLFCRVKVLYCRVTRKNATLPEMSITLYVMVFLFLKKHRPPPLIFYHSSIAFHITSVVVECSFKSFAVHFTKHMLWGLVCSSFEVYVTLPCLVIKYCYLLLSPYFTEICSQTLRHNYLSSLCGHYHPLSVKANYNLYWRFVFFRKLNFFIIIVDYNWL